MADRSRLAIIGAGNIGRAMAVGLAAAGRFPRDRIILTRRRVERLADLAAEGFDVESDNRSAVRRAAVLIVAVEPGRLDEVLREIRDELDAARHLLISVVSGATLADISREIGKELPLARAMPNTGVAVGRSMTCVATHSDSKEVRECVVSIFDSVGRTLVIDEELMTPATALGACGVAFFLRAIRAAAQGGIEIGFHPEEALTLAAQTALGAAALVLEQARHPEREIDNVTTPRGCTIAGLNELEHHGFSSALIKGITTSAEKARLLYARGGGAR
jgi:pyrroline-5-carboxylate reductase